MAFPTTGILDNFNRANENPLGNGTWSGPLFTTDNRDQLISNAVTLTSGNCSDYWITTFGPDSHGMIRPRLERAARPETEGTGRLRPPSSF